MRNARAYQRKIDCTCVGCVERAKLGLSLRCGARRRARDTVDTRIGRTKSIAGENAHGAGRRSGNVNCWKTTGMSSLRNRKKESRPVTRNARRHHSPALGTAGRPCVSSLQYCHFPVPKPSNNPCPEEPLGTFRLSLLLTLLLLFSGEEWRAGHVCSDGRLVNWPRKLFATLG